MPERPAAGVHNPCLKDLCWSTEPYRPGGGTTHCPYEPARKAWRSRAGATGHGAVEGALGPGHI